MKAPYRCPKCVEQGQPENWAKVQCAFRADGSWTGENWACGTMNFLRERADYHGLRSRQDNNSCAMAPVQTGWVVMEYYKERGRVDAAWFIGDGAPRQMRLDDLTREFDEC